jgi:hypothetical protein
LSSLIEALDAKAKEYMKRVIQEMVLWRKREAELIAFLITRNTRRLQERLASYRIVPRRVWSPRGVVSGGPVDLPEGEPYALFQVWPKPQGMEDMFVDTVKLYSANVSEKTVTKDSNVVYKEKVLEPASDTGEVEELPKYPFFDNLALSPAELLDQLSKRLSHFIIEIVLDREVEYTDCSMEVVGSDYHYYCKPQALRYVAVPPGEYKPWAGTNVDFKVTHPARPEALLHNFTYYGEYTALNILYFTQDSTQYTIAVNWAVMTGFYNSATIGTNTYDVRLASTVVLAYVENQNTPANVKFVSLHVPGGVGPAKFTYTDSNNNYTYYVVAFDSNFKRFVDVIQSS